MYFYLFMWQWDQETERSLQIYTYSFNDSVKIMYKYTLWKLKSLYRYEHVTHQLIVIALLKYLFNVSFWYRYKSHSCIFWFNYKIVALDRNYKIGTCFYRFAFINFLSSKTIDRKQELKLKSVQHIYKTIGCETLVTLTAQDIGLHSVLHSLSVFGTLMNLISKSTKKFIVEKWEMSIPPTPPPPKKYKEI